MSEEADRLVEAFDDAVVLTATTDVMDREDFKVAHDKWSASRAALLAYIERVERERCTCDEETGHHDPMCVLAVRETARTMAARMAALEAECATVREVSRILDGFRGDPPTPSQWAHICEMAYLLRLKLGASAARKQ